MELGSAATDGSQLLSAVVPQMASVSKVAAKAGLGYASSATMQVMAAASGNARMAGRSTLGSFGTRLLRKPQPGREICHHHHSSNGPRQGLRARTIAPSPRPDL